MPYDRCAACFGYLYDSTDSQQHGIRSWSCLMCGRIWFEPVAPPPPRPIAEIAPAKRGRPRKEAPGG